MRYEVMPGHWVEGEVYEAVSASLAEQVPHLFPALTWEDFVRPGGGMFAVPDAADEVSKVELILLNTPAATVKVNCWLRPDLRAGGRPVPHNHRWRTMASRVLTGGYEDQVTTAGVHGYHQVVHRHDAGLDNVLHHHQFHEVVAVEPGTWTVLVGDGSQPGDWGHLDLETGWYRHHAEWSPDPNFEAAFLALNRRL